MKRIKLPNHKYALVDADDYENLKDYKWLSSRNYVYRHQTKSEYGDNPRKNVILHRIIMKAPDDKVVDHINRNPLDNRKNNLRICTMQENLFNRPKLKTKTSIASKFKGVILRPYKRWESSIKHNGQNNYLGTFSTEKEAALAYNKKAQELFGEFALLNQV